MTDPARRMYTEEEYLNWESEERVRLEYVDGFIYAQAGASIAHNKISTNILLAIGPVAQRKGCESYTADLKIRVPGQSSNRYYLPDLVVVCNSNLEEHDVETTPCLIVEILSVSTRKTDLMHKSGDYQSLPSLQGYLIVDSEQQEVSLHRRTEQGWQIEMVEDSVDLPCLGVSLSVEEIYARTQVPLKE